MLTGLSKKFLVFFIYSCIYLFQFLFLNYGLATVILNPIFDSAAVTGQGLNVTNAVLIPQFHQRVKKAIGATLWSMFVDKHSEPRH